MNRLLLSGFLVLTITSAHAQRAKLYRSIIHTSQGERIDGILYDVTDSTVRYVPNQADFIQRLRAGQTPAVFDAHLTTIDRIVIRRKGHVGRGALIGSGVGLATGLVMAVALPQDRGNGYASAYINLARIALILSAPIGGAEYGTLLSLIPHKVIRIRQHSDSYKSAKFALKRLSFVDQQWVNSFAPVRVTPSNQYP